MKSIKSFAEKKPVLLLCDDDDSFRMALGFSLKEDFKILNARSPHEATAVVKNHTIDALLLDVHFNGQTLGIDFIPKLLEANPGLPILVLSSASDYLLVRQAMQNGARDYLKKDLPVEEIIHAIKNLLENQQLLRTNEKQNFELKERQSKHQLIGTHPSISRLREIISKARNASANVVITGETGTGKEVVARLLRKTLPCGNLEPFVAIDSSTIQSTTAESVLFGYEKGAFTGAEKTTRGVFEEADGGVVYFDEISNMPIPIQNKLLRVLQEKEVLRLGGTKPIPLDFRVVCATNQDLDLLVSRGEFKADLLQRLAVIPISIPKLSERGEDVLILLDHFLDIEFLGNRPPNQSGGKRKPSLLFVARKRSRAAKFGFLSEGLCQREHHQSPRPTRKNPVLQTQFC